jgi:hypothetical protein
VGEASKIASLPQALERRCIAEALIDTSRNGNTVPWLPTSQLYQPRGTLEIAKTLHAGTSQRIWCVGRT